MNDMKQAVETVEQVARRRYAEFYNRAGMLGDHEGPALRALPDDLRFAIVDEHHRRTDIITEAWGARGEVIDYHDGRFAPAPALSPAQIAQLADQVRDMVVAALTADPGRVSMEGLTEDSEVDLGDGKPPWIARRIVGRRIVIELDPPALADAEGVGA